MLAAEDLQGLNIPQDAKLVAISTEKQADGAQQWTLTYRLEPQSSSGIAPQGAPAPMAPHPACGSSGTTAAPGLPPPPPPLNSAQILSKRESKNVIGSASLDSPGVAPFPVLPYQPGSPNRLFPLRCAVMTYAWGKIGADSLVGQLAASGDADFAIDENMPYSELWMGTHASGPSMVMLEEPYRIITPLYDWLKLNPFMRKSTKSNLTNEQQVERDHTQKDGRMHDRADRRMDGWTDGRMDGWTDGRMDGWMDGFMGRRMKRRTYVDVARWCFAR
eukprot:6214648-Pleurochrysis_carterae.AAC.1